MSTPTAESEDAAPIDDARDELQAAVPEAAATLRNLLNAEDERVQIRAAEAILDRAGVTEAKKTTTTAAARDIGGEGDETDLASMLSQ